MSTRHSWLGRALGSALALVSSLAVLGACGDDASSDDDDTPVGGGPSAGAAQGGTGNASSGGRNTSGSNTGGAAAGRPAMGDSGSSSTAGASAGGRAGTTNGGRANAGSSGLGRPMDDPGGAGGAFSAPMPGPDGKSPYTIECHGDSRDCGDPALRCLGIRDTTAVHGYSCSNSCQNVDDCSDADSGVEASADCVDFVSSKHCMLVCKDEQRGDRDCPTGMSCYVFPGALIGYCLWQ